MSLPRWKLVKSAITQLGLTHNLQNLFCFFQVVKVSAHGTVLSFAVELYFVDTAQL